MKKPTRGDGLAISESLYKTPENLPTPDPNNKPTLIRGIDRQLSPSEQEIAEKAYKHGFDDGQRMTPKTDDPMLHAMYEACENHRAKMLRQGRIKPANKEERKIKLGIK